MASTSQMPFDANIITVAFSGASSVLTVESEFANMSASSTSSPPDPALDLGAPLEPDDHDNVETDSAYGGPDGSFTTSVGDSVMNYQYENGRRYHAYREGEYPLPNDEREQDRLDLLHHIFKLMLGGNLLIAPIPTNPQRVLDFGTGTGIWALDFADEYPSATVVGTDLSPIQPLWVASNSEFLVDDVEDEWTFSPGEAFDIIHGRGMVGSIKDWQRLYSQVYTHLKPGGLIEMQEYEVLTRSDDDENMSQCPCIVEWRNKMNEGSAMLGKRMDVASEQKEKLIAAGFEGVTDIVQKLPLGPWPKDPKQKEIGRYSLVQILDSVEPFTLAIFTRALGWRIERVQGLMAGVRNELRNPRNHLYVLVHFIYGKKPNTI